MEVDDDILAVFIVDSSQIRELYIAKNANMDRVHINSIFESMDFGEDDKITKEEKGTLDLIVKEGFKMLWMKEEHEEPVTLYLVASLNPENN